MKNSEFDFIKDKFNFAMPDVPSGLSEKAIEKKINLNTRHNAIKFNKRSNHTAILAAAACFIMLLGFGFRIMSESTARSFKSYNEIYSVVERTSPSEEGCRSEAAVKRLYDADEACPITIYGEYIYSIRYGVNGENKLVIIREVDGKKQREVALNTTLADSYSVRLYATKNRLAVIGSNDKQTSIGIYDISKPDNPILINELSQSGSCLKGYFVNEKLYVLSYFNVVDKKDAIPMLVENNKNKILIPEKISYIDNIDTSCYILINVLDIKTGKPSDEAKALFGVSCVLDCVGNSLYLSNCEESNDVIKIELGEKIKFVNVEKEDIKVIETDTDLIEISANRFIGVAHNGNDLNGDVASLYCLDNGKLKKLYALDLGNITAYASDNADYITVSESTVYMPCYIAQPDKRIDGITKLTVEGDKLVSDIVSEN